MKTTDFARYLTSFLGSYLPTLRNVSSNTVSSYSDTFRLFLQYYQSTVSNRIEHLTMKQFNIELITGFLEWLEKERNCSVSTRNQRLACIHAFIRYVETELPENLFELQKILAMPSKKCTHENMTYLSVEAMSALLNEPDISTKRGRRDLMLLTLLYDSGTRVQELINLSVKDVRTSAPATITLLGKGRKIRSIPLMSRTNKMLVQYLKEQQFWERPEKLDSPLFFNSRSERLTRAGITHIIKKYVDAAKNSTEIIFPEKVTPHVFRHTKAMHLLQSNINLIYIRDFLGHVSITTTEIYARADSEIKRKALEAAYVKAEAPMQPDWNDDKNLMVWLKNICK